MATLPIRIPCYHALMPDGSTARLLSDSEREARELAAKGEGRDADNARARLDLDARIRTEGTPRLWTVLMARPDYRDVLAIRSIAAEAMQTWCTKRDRTPDEATFAAFEKVTRPEVLFLGVEDETGNDVGKWADVPDDLKPDIAELLAVLVRLTPEESAFFLRSAAGTAPAATDPDPEAGTNAPDSSPTP